MNTQTNPHTVPEQCVAFNIGKAYRSVLRLFEKNFRSCEISTMQYGLLIHISNLQPAAGRDISNATGHDPSTLSRTLSSLVEDGYVSVRPETSGDKRKRIYELTADGEAALQNTIPIWAQTQNTIVQRIGQDQWDNVLQVLHELQGIDPE